MTRRGDDGREMPHGPFDDDAFDAMLRGTPHPESDAASFASFVDDVRAAAEAVPIPSAALAVALASGISPSAADPQPRWRKWKMKIQGFLAGLSVAGKCALGVGVAAAATTGAGAAGVLPGPVQHAFSKVVHTVAPFEEHGGGGQQANGHHDGDGTTTTSVGGTTSTTLRDGDGKPPTNGGGDGGVTTSPTTTERHEGDGTPPTTISTPPTTEHVGDGGGDGGQGGDGEHGGDTPTTIPTTTTTEHHDGDSNNPESLSLNCVRNHEPASVTCTWSASSSPDHSRYLLLRVDGDGEHSGRVVDSTEDGLTFTDTTVVPGHGYGYRVISVRADNSVESHSPMVTLMCCGDA
jgi:hypothetical protein